MSQRLGIDRERVRIVPTGISLEGYPRPLPAEAADKNEPSTPNVPRTESDGVTEVVRGKVAGEGDAPSIALPPAPATAPVLGYFARMCPDKGLHTLVEAFIQIRRHARVTGLRLKAGGSCGPVDEPFVRGLRDRLHAEGLLGEAEFHPNLNHSAKIAFLRSLTVFSVPALYGEAFGLYLLEAWAAGVPVVQPEHAAFPEMVRSTGGGVLSTPGEVGALADAIEGLLLDPSRHRRLARAGHTAAHERFSAEAGAREMLMHLGALVQPRFLPSAATTAA